MFSLLQDECASEVPPGKTTQVDPSADVAFIPREEDDVFDWRTLEGAEPPRLSDLTAAQQNDVTRLLAEFPSVTSGTLGRTTVVEHKVHIENSQPIRQQPYRVAMARREVL